MRSRFHRTSVTIALLLAAVAWTAHPAHALDPKPTAWASGFVGLTIGESKTYGYSAGSDTVLARNDDTSFSYVVFGGYQFQNSGPYHTTDRGLSPSAGFGYNWYAIDHKLGVHAEYSRFFNVGDDQNSGHRYDRDFLSVGMIWSFR